MSEEQKDGIRYALRLLSALSVSGERSRFRVMVWILQWGRRAPMQNLIVRRPSMGLSHDLRLDETHVRVLVL